MKFYLALIIMNAISYTERQPRDARRRVKTLFIIVIELKLIDKDA